MTSIEASASEVRSYLLSTQRWIGIGILTVVATFAVIGPPLIGADPLRPNLRDAFAGLSGAHPLGTDHLGRDNLARLAHGTRRSLGFGLASVVTAALLGVSFGLLAAWRGGLVDRVLSMLCSGVMALPGILIILMVAAFAPGAFWPLYLGLALALWVEYFRVVRAMAATRLARPDVEAARLLRLRPTTILRRHLLPDLGPIVVTLMAFGLATAVVAVATLSYIGIGLRPPTPELGAIMAELMPHYDRAPSLLLMPAGMLLVTVVGLFLLTGRDPR